MKRWRFFIDRGGTFTDLIGVSPAGELSQLKLLSSDEAPLEGIRKLMGLSAEQPIPACEVRLGTTLATNALLERRGRRAALMISRGFGDLLELGTTARPELFALQIDKPEVVYSRVLEVNARCDAAGRVLARPEERPTLEQLTELVQGGITSLAIVVVHAYANPELELLLAEWARRAGVEHVVWSADVAREMGLLRRADTAVLDAYLTPVLAEYVRKLRAALPGSELLVMQSSGRLAAPELLRGPAALLSGPAAGVVACARLAELCAEPRAIGFDMGGTSTDVSRVAAELPLVYETTTARVRVVAPMMDIHTVAAGGGSLCTFDGYRLAVGPESAGADPGPLCYGRKSHGEDSPDAGLTLTDVNLLLGRLLPDRFPFPLEQQPAAAGLNALHARVLASGARLSVDEVAAGLLEIANDNMARAIERVSLARGHDVREHSLIVFGGAGGQHACAVARKLGLTRLLFHSHSGVFSALGMGLAQRGVHDVAHVGAACLDEAGLQGARQQLAALRARAVAKLNAAGVSSELTSVERLDLCYQGTETPLTLAVAPLPELRAAFDAEHLRRFGYQRVEHPVAIVAARIEMKAEEHLDAAQLLGPRARPVAPTTSAAEARRGAPVRVARIYCDGAWHDDVPVYRREDLSIGQRVPGPACILEATGTIVLDPGFEGEVWTDRVLCVQQLERVSSSAAAQRGSSSAAAASDGARTDPITLEIMGNAFMNIAEQMGAVLRRTASSTNIRERLDFSCAVFDADANLIANAPHIPVHLGAMGESVSAVAARHPDAQEGDVFITNDPASGGSHLPDITVVTPVFDAGERVFYVANRGHHADVGGITPGSMPPFSHSLVEEGVVFEALRVVHAGHFDERGLRAVLGSGPYPARHPDQNVADLRAQIVANQLGKAQLLALSRAQGSACLRSIVADLRELAAAQVRSMLLGLGELERQVADVLDDGTRIELALCVRDGKLSLRFAPTPEHEGNANTPRAIVISAVLYVLRCMLGRGIPLNSGCLLPVEIVTPEGSLLAPSRGRAVSSGNVETSQRIVDVLLSAFGLAAASQGTMNNVSFGNQHFSYYETLGGGAGAGPDFTGASAVQVHMTNTRITDVEVLESRYPVRIERFALRLGSGGAGRFPGGDGLVREYRFLEPVEVALVSERRATRPPGMAGGAPGQAGRNLLNDAVLPGRARFTARAGDTLTICTPGGGGYGDPLTRRTSPTGER